MRLNVFTTQFNIKQTNTGVYLPKIAFSPMQYKTAAIRASIFSAYKIISCMEIFVKLTKKGFHFKYIDKIAQKVIAYITTERSFCILKAQN